MAPSVIARAHTAFPELREDRPHRQPGDDSRPLTKADLTKTREDRLSVQARRNDRVVPARIRRADYHGYRCVMHHETFAATATLSIRAQRQFGVR